MSARDDKRLVPLRIRLPYTTAEEFLDKYGAYLTATSIFIITRAPKPEGTSLSFEVVLADGRRLMRGEGVVERTSADQGTRGGMSVRFGRLDTQGKVLVERASQRKAGAPNAAAAESESHPPAPAAESEPPPITARRPAKKSDDVVVGIDLGTSRSRLAILDRDGPRLVPLDSAPEGMPSLVAADERGRLLIGDRAIAFSRVVPQSALAGAKRLVGQLSREPRARRAALKVPVTLVPDASGQVAAELCGRTYPLTELTAVLLRELLDRAEKSLGSRPQRAVICVPAYFTDRQRHAVLEAARRADLNDVRLLNEPSAAALAFGYRRALARKRVLVYDFGGGTFDVAVVQVTGDDLEVISTAGDDWLGGIDLDEAVASELWARIGQGQPVPDLSLKQRLLEAAERAKIELSTEEVTHVELPLGGAPPSDAPPLELRIELTRAKLEELIAPLVDLTLAQCREVLAAAGLTAEHIDEVVVVGGQSQTPLVQRRLQEAFGKPVRTDVDAHGAVALGAAILGHGLAQESQGRPGVLLSDVLSLPIGVAVPGGGFKRILERNTRLPAEKTFLLPVTAGESVGVAVFQGAFPRAEDNQFLGSLSATPQKRGETSVRFQVAVDGRVSVAAVSPDGAHPDVLMSTEDVSPDLLPVLMSQSPFTPEAAASGPGLFRSLRKLLSGRA